MTDDNALTGSRGDLLLKWLNARAFGSWAQFKEAIMYLYPGDGARSFDVALRLAALGHVEFDWDGVDLGWNAVPASCYALTRNGARYLGVCGRLPADVLSALADARILVESDYEMFLPGETIERVLVPSTAVSRRIISDDFGIALAMTAYSDLRLRLPSVMSLVSTGELIDVPLEAGRFNNRTGQFEDDTALQAPLSTGLFRVRDYPRSTYFWLSADSAEGTTARVIDRTIGMWAAYIAGPAQKYSLRGGSLSVPAFPSLPILYERMLYFSGARCVSRNSAEIVFDHVDGDVVGALLQKLPLQRRGV